MSSFANAQTASDPAVIVRFQENQSAGLAAEWLGSADPRFRAWGAYIALRDGRRELLPQLIALAATAPVGGDPDHNAMLQVLDAIIQMDGRVPPEVAAKLYPEFPVPALILLSRAGPMASSFLLDIFREETSRKPGETIETPLVSDGLVEPAQEVDAWLTVGNLLRNLKPAGFTAAVLSGFAENIQVRVVDEGSGSGGSGRGYGTSCSHGLPERPDWPTVGNYSFAGAGNLVLSNGVDPSFYTRTLGGAIRGELACGWRSSRDLVSEHFLAALAGEPPEAVSVRASTQSIIKWRDDDQYIKELHATIDRQQDAIDRLSAKLLSAGFLSADERQLARPSLQLWISDERSEKASALPMLQDLGRNVRIIN